MLEASLGSDFDGLSPNGAGGPGLPKPENPFALNLSTYSDLYETRTEKRLA